MVNCGIATEQRSLFFRTPLCFEGRIFDLVRCSTSKLSVNDNLVPRVISPRFPICSRHIGKREDPGDIRSVRATRIH